MLCQLHHPNIIECLGVAEDSAKDMWYLVQAFADRGDLSHLIKSPDLTPRLFKQVVSELLEAVAYIHLEKNMAHLDIKVIRRL